MKARVTRKVKAWIGILISCAILLGGCAMPQVEHKTDICVELNMAVMDPPGGEQTTIYRDGKVIRDSFDRYGEEGGVETTEGRMTAEGIKEIDRLLYTRRFLGLKQTEWESADGATYEIVYHYGKDQDFTIWDDNFTDKQFEQYYSELVKLVEQYTVFE